MKRSTKTAGTGNGTQDIEHEIVVPGNDQETSSVATITTEDQIKLELAKFNIADAAVAWMVENYGAMEINGPDDKDGYKAVKAAWNEVRSTRTGFEKKGLELRGRYKVITTAISKEEDRLIDLVTPLEGDLFKKWKAIDDERDRIEKQKEQDEQRLLMERVEDVLAIGMTFRDGFYVIGDTISMDVATLRALPDEQYTKLRAAIQAKATELKKLAADEAAEKKRQQDQLKKEQDDLKQQQEQLRHEQAEMAKQRQEFRTAKLEGVGMKLNPRTGLFSFDTGHSGFSINLLTVMEMDSAQFTENLAEAVQLIKKHQDEKAKHDEDVRLVTIAREKKEKYIAGAMEAAGFSYSYTGRAFTWENDIDAFAISFDELLAMDDDAIALKADYMANKRIESIKQSAEREKNRKAEQEKQDRLALRDKQRWYEIITDLEVAADKIDPTAFKAKTYQTKATHFLNKLTVLLKEFK